MHAAYLIPEYDESLTGGKDLNVADLPGAKGKKAWRDVWYRPVILGGRRAGTWRRRIGNGKLTIDTNLFAPVDAKQHRAITAAVRRYGEFLELPATWTGHDLVRHSGD